MCLYTYMYMYMLAAWPGRFWSPSAEPSEVPRSEFSRAAPRQQRRELVPATGGATEVRNMFV